MKIVDLDDSYVALCRDSLSTEKAHSLESSNNWEHVDQGRVELERDELYKKLSPLIGVMDIASEDVQDCIKRHFDIACRFYTPSREAYIGMALFNEENIDMKAFYNAYHVDMVEFLGDAICVFSLRNL